MIRVFWAHIWAAWHGAFCAQCSDSIASGWRRPWEHMCPKGRKHFDEYCGMVGE